MTIRVKTKGTWGNSRKGLTRLVKGDIYRDLAKYGQKGVNALRDATPRESGETANSWDYVIEKKRGGYTITWVNRHENDGVQIAILIQYGHGTGTGGYVQGRDYINPAVQPIFDQIADDVWRRVRE